MASPHPSTVAAACAWPSPARPSSPRSPRPPPRPCPSSWGNQADISPRSLTPGFLLDRGRYSTLEVPGAIDTAALDINNRGQIAIVAPDPPPSPGGRN
jgi:hypothetical protein